MDTLHLVTIILFASAAFWIWHTITSDRDYRAAFELDLPAPYVPAEFAMTSENDGDDSVTPGSAYTVEHRQVFPQEFDDGTGYLEVGAEIRVKDNGFRELVVTIGNVDFALTDAPLLASALLAMHFALIEAEGLSIGVIEQ